MKTLPKATGGRANPKSQYNPLVMVKRKKWNHMRPTKTIATKHRTEKEAIMMIKLCGTTSRMGSLSTT
jgi:hypothetical protein